MPGQIPGGVLVAGPLVALGTVALPLCLDEMGKIEGWPRLPRATTLIWMS